MCRGPNSKVCPMNLAMEGGGFRDEKIEVFCESSILLELSASDDLDGFRCAVEDKGFDVEKPSYWYGRRIGQKNMGFEERTPLMIASMFGSTKVLGYIIGTGKVDINRACGSEGVTALHCAAAGGSALSVEIVKLLLDASADIDSVDANGNKPQNLMAPNLKFCKSERKMLFMMLKGDKADEEGPVAEQMSNQMPQLSKEGADKKEYPIDVTLPDINNGIYGSDEFRMYSFKVKPCSRAYSHDWTECPFAHPGENARRRDPRKYSYSCVPCPDFRKGTCMKSDACEYAHGVFECWLHPAQYRTRLCKDETGCSRKVCFFAHKPEELRPLYASTGSGMPSPKSMSLSAGDMASLSPLALGSSSLMMPPTSTPPMSPSAACSLPTAGTMWQNKVNLTPPALQLPGSRLKTALSVRDLDLETEMLGLDHFRIEKQQQMQLADEMSNLSSPSYWNKQHNRIGDLKPSNLDSLFGSLDPSLISQFQGNSQKVSTTTTQMHSPAALQIRQNMNQLRASYPTNLSSSPVRKSSMYGFDTSGAVAAAVMNSKSTAFAKRSQSFIDRGALNRHPGLNTAANSPSLTMPSTMSDWSSPNGKLEWGFQGEDLNKLKKSASFGFRNGNATATKALSSIVDEPDVSWVHSLVKDVPSVDAGLYGSEQKLGGVLETLPSWVEQLYIDQEQMVA